MPSIQVLPKVQGFGERFGEAFGQGFQSGMQSALQDFLKRKDNLSKGSSDAINRLQKEYKFRKMEGYGSEALNDAYAFTKELVGRGVNADEAGMAGISFLETWKKDQNAAKSILEEYGIGPKKSKESKTATQRLEAEGAKAKEGAKEKKEETFAERLGFKGNPERTVATSGEYLKGFNRTGAVTPTNLLLEHFGIQPGPVSKQAAMRTGEQLFPTPEEANQAGTPESIAKRAGELTPLVATAPQSLPLAAGELALGTAGGEAAKAAGFGELGQLGGELAGFSLPALAKGAWNLIKRIPSTLKAVTSAAKVAGIGEEKVVQEAAKNLSQEGVDVAKAAQGDPQTIKALKDESEKVAKTYQEAGKFNQKEVAKVREDVAKKLPESPLEEYYAPKKEVKHRPETVAKETARLEKLAPEIETAKKFLLDSQYHVLEGKNLLRSGKFAEGTPEYTNVLGRIEHAAEQHERALEKLRALEFEKKYGHPPMPASEINAQIDKSFAELTKAIENPTASKLEKMREQIAKDKGAISKAERLASRGEIPGKQVQDQFIKIQREYSNAYKQLADELKDLIKASDDPTKIANAKELLKTVEEARQVSKAKIANQIDKRRVQGALDKPSGAFYKQQLKDLRKDVYAFQKDFFQYGRVKNPAEFKTHQQAKKIPKLEAKEAPNAPEGMKKGPFTGESAEAQAAKSAKEEIKSPKGENKTLGEQLNEEAKRYGAEIEAGKVSQKIENSLANKATNYIKAHYRNVPKAILSGSILGTVQGLVEEATGAKIPLGIFGLFGGRGFGGRGTSYGVSSIVHSQVKNGFNHIYAEKLKERKNSPEYSKYLKELADKFSVTRANQIKKLAESNK